MSDIFGQVYNLNRDTIRAEESVKAMAGHIIDRWWAGQSCLDFGIELQGAAVLAA